MIPFDVYREMGQRESLPGSQTQQNSIEIMQTQLNGAIT